MQLLKAPRAMLTFLMFILLVTASGEVRAQENIYLNRSDSCIKMFPGVDDAFIIRRRMIASANEEILMSYYAYTDAEKPYYILAMLREATYRGVKVKMILDWMNSKIPESVLQYLENIGIEIKYFNALTPRNLLRIDRRKHDKYLIVDRKYVLVGGRNISEKYFDGDLDESGTFYDIDAFFEGEPAAQAAAYFDERWKSSWVKLPKHLFKQFDQALYEDVHVQTVENIELLRTDTTFVSVKGYLKTGCTDAEFVANDPHTRKRNRPVEDLHIQYVDSARHSIDLQNPYLLLTPRFKKALKRAIDRGVHVRVVANSLQSTDVTLTYAGYLNLRRQLLKWGVEIHEFMHNQTMHSKVAIFDKKTAIIGSFNLDPRSAYRNSETVVVSSDRVAVRELQDYFNNSLALSTYVNRKGIPQGYDTKHPNTSRSKRISAKLYRFTLAPLLRTFL